MHPPRPRAAHPAPTPRRTPRLAYPLAGTGLTLPVTLLLLQVRLNWLLPTSVASVGIMLAHLSATCAHVLPAVSPWHCQLVAAGMAAAGMLRRGVVLLHRLGSSIGSSGPAHAPPKCCALAELAGIGHGGACPA